MSAVVDFHTHFFSRTFFEALAAASPLPGSREEIIANVASKVGIDVPSESHEEHLDRWLGEVERFGLEQIVAFASVPQEAEVVIQMAERSGGKLAALCQVDPRNPEAVAAVESWVGRGVRGVLLFPAAHGFDVDGPEAGAVFRVLEASHGLAIVHCGLFSVPLRDHFALPRTYDFRRADPLQLVAAAHRHPDVTFVIPHFGAGMLRETLMAGRLAENIHVDTSSSNRWVDVLPQPLSMGDIFDRALRVFGPDRILFGTDSSIFPRGWRHDILTVQREALGACGLSAQERHQILAGNAQRLLGL